MKNQEIKFNSLKHNYSVFIGKNVIKLLPKKIKNICPKARKIALIVDTKIPKKLKKTIKDKLSNYEIVNLPFSMMKKISLLKKVDFYLIKYFQKILIGRCYYWSWRWYYRRCCWICC